jgi:transcriptional antiterminator RfaH
MNRPEGVAGLLPVGLAWYCLKAKNKRESFASRQLVDRTQLEVFAPRLEVRRRGMRPNATMEEPLFPGYVFCRFDLSVDLRFALSTPDIIGIVRFGDRTPPVPDDMIAFLRAQTKDATCTEPLLVPGDWVQVLTGTFMGQTARVVSFEEGKDRALVLLSLLGNDVRVSLPIGHLQGARLSPVVPPSLRA